MRAFDIEAIIVALERARDHAVKAGFDEFFIHDINHLIATAEINREEQE